MFVYIFIDLSIILLGLGLGRQNQFTYGDDIGEMKIKYRNLYYFLIALMLIFFSAFRGDFSTDYTGYESIFVRFQHMSFNDILRRSWSKNPENGYLIFQNIIRLFSDNVIWIFIISTVIIVCCNIHEIKKYYAFGVLPLLLFVELGNYYISFNLVRQVMAASIVVAGSRFLYERKFWKYLVVVLLASSIHLTAIMMIPAYFILNLKMNKSGVIMLVGGTTLLYAFLPRIISLVMNYAWGWYNYDGLLTGYSIKNVVGPFILAIIPIVGKLVEKNIPQKDDNEPKISNNTANIWLNATYFFIALVIVGLRVSMMKRMAIYFSTYALLACSKTVYEARANRRVLFLAICAICILFGFVTTLGSELDPYYFIWNR